MTSLLLIEKEDRVLHLTLNRPDKRNALSAELCHELSEALTKAQDDDSIGAILLDAAGRVFCSGMDLDEARSASAQTGMECQENLFSIGRWARKPIVACVNGPAMGGGVGLIAQAHVAVAAQGALFGLTEVRIGMWPFLIYRSIEAAIGARRTLELSLTGRLFSSHEALAWGLIHQTAHAFEVEDRASAIARDLSKASPSAIRLGFEYVHSSRDKDWTQAGEIAAKLRTECTESPDFKEGVAAFHAHREAHWPSMPESGHNGSAGSAPAGSKLEEKPHHKVPEFKNSK
jgi:enoyl-CoA hydratase/carnithine racemase